ncbi:MAG: pitrilysin family protein [Acidobacteria bacterium]|nr:pitrilysin family protein [Acidobacteriota bacterium]
MESQSIDVPFSKHILGNQLQVIIHEDHACPLAAVNLWYHVGSKNEAAGRTGLAHLFEHLMFEPSKHFGKTYFELLQRAGGQINGSTNTDRTNYWELVPSNALELALWMESDRMMNMLPSLTSTAFETQRDVVLNERRQNYENRPYGLAMVALAAALFPPDHPYHWITIGAPADLRNATLGDVQAFFRQFYHPANASLAIAGDVDPSAVLDLVNDYFGTCSAGEAPPAIALAPVGAATSRLVLEDRVELPRLYQAWLTPAHFADGDADLDLAADILAGGKPSRLYRRLVYADRIATDVSASQSSRDLGSFFAVAVTAVPGVSLDVIEEAVAGELAAFAREGPARDELARAQALTETAFVSRLQHVGGFGGRSDQLNSYNVSLGEPGFFTRDLNRYRDATTESVRAAAARHLLPGHQVTLSVVPAGCAALAASGSDPVDVS